MKAPYLKLGLLLAVNTVVMFLITYAMIASFEHFDLNVNRLYMALLMVSPMAILMLVAMGPMFRSRPANVALGVGFAAVFAVVLWLVRTQTTVGDEQFLRSMIPHHSSAILMCERAEIDDPEILDLCDQIVRSQRDEIAQMERILKRY